MINAAIMDLALRKNLPGFIDTIKTISLELEVDQVIIAEGTSKTSPHIEKSLLEIFPMTIVVIPPSNCGSYLSAISTMISSGA